MNKALPYVCALPTDQWRLNVNTLPAEQAALLAAMFSPTLSPESAKTLLEGRPSMVGRVWMIFLPNRHSPEWITRCVRKRRNTSV